MLAHTGPVLALDWSPPSSSAAHRVDIVEENVILGGGAGGREGAGIMGGISAGKQAEGEGEGKRGWIVSGSMDKTVKVRQHSHHRLIYFYSRFNRK